MSFRRPAPFGDRAAAQMVRAQGRLLLTALLAPVFGSRPKIDLEARRVAGFLGWEDSWPDGLAPKYVGLTSDIDFGFHWPEVLRHRRPITRRSLVVRKRGSVYRWPAEGRCLSCWNRTSAELPSSLAGVTSVGSVSNYSHFWERAAESRDALSRTLHILFPTLCGSSGAYTSSCEPDGHYGAPLRNAVGVCDFPGIQCVAKKVPISMLFNCSQPPFLNISSVRRRIPAVIGRISFLMTIEFSDCPFLGPLPPEIGNLDMLEELHIVRCPLGGTVPTVLGQLGQLVLLSLDHAELTGPIPQDVGRLGLKLLTMQGNNLSGSLPSELWTLSQLEHLDLAHNHLGGLIPEEIGQLSHLTYLDLQHNLFEGGVPLALGKLQKLKWLDLCLNNLQGWIPAELGQLSSLEMLDIQKNTLGGKLPAALGRLRSLDTLDLSDNNLEGPIPEELGQLHLLEWLDLSSNNLTDAIPASLAYLRKLRLLSLDNNDLSGQIPSNLSKLQTLRFLGLSDNWLTGQIPASLGNMKSLLVLHLADNLLAGVIPPELSNLRRMVGLFLFKNRLTGRIPTEFALLPRLSFLALHENSLHDKVPRFKLHYCHKEECEQDMLLTLYGNHLSCRLPTPVDKKDRKYLKTAVVQANKFSLPVPKWLEGEVDPVHFQSSGKMRKTGLTLAAGALLWVISVLLVLRLDLISFVRTQVLRRATQDEPEAAAHLELMGLVFAMVCVSISFVLPACYVGSKFTQCGDEWSHFSMTYLSRSPLSEGVVGASLIVHLVMVFVFIASLPISENPSNLLTVIKKGVGYMGWLFVVFCAALLPTLYASMRVLPWDNAIKSLIGTNIYTCLYYGAPIGSAIVQALIVPIFAATYAQRMEVSIRQLLTITHFICVWSAPMLAVVYMGEGCGKRWRLFWNICDSDSLDTDFTIWNKTIHVVTRESICNIPTMERLFLQHNGGCSRDILEALTPLLMQGLAMEAVIFPILYLVTWLLAELSEDGQELKLRRLGTRVSFTVEEYFIMLDIWATTAVFWGALVPLLQPLVLVAVCVSFVMNRLETCYFGCRAPPSPQPEGVDADERTSKQVEAPGQQLTEEDRHISKHTLQIAAAFVSGFIAVFVAEMVWVGEV